MNNRRYRHRLLALSASILLGLSGLSSSAVDAAEVTVEQPAADTTVSQDTGNPSADTKEAAEGQTEGETTEPEPVKEKPKKEKKKGPGLFGRLTKGIDTFGKTLFDDDDNESK